MVSFTLQMIYLSTDGYCMVLVMEAAISMKLLEKITMNFVQAAFEQMHCGNKIAVGREDGTPRSSPEGCSNPAEPGQVVLPSLVTRGGLPPPATVKLALGWSCWKHVLSNANSACYA